jgi:hypothetical protein
LNLTKKSDAASAASLFYFVDPGVDLKAFDLSVASPYAGYLHFACHGEGFFHSFTDTTLMLPILKLNFHLAQ